MFFDHNAQGKFEFGYYTPHKKVSGAELFVKDPMPSYFVSTFV